ncbi:triose-phosphate isomerase [Paraburkholderia sp. JHI2823]|uniref:triose-phosphate isomerase n=1 Tax=Paraburkholderia TaxID=1822464 RepID=UPI0009DD5178|nr:triose-phosphate isomerase [Paraburkholderia mimosarum]
MSYVLYKSWPARVEARYWEPPPSSADVFALEPECGVDAIDPRAARIAGVRGALARLSPEQRCAPILLAYEPVWAIGEHGVPASPEYADARQAAISLVAQAILGRRIPCLYGDSVNPDNCAELTACPNIDGLFIGRSAWNVSGYLEILKRVGSVL